MENKVIFIILTAILVVTLIFNSILVSKRVSHTYAYGLDYLEIVDYEFNKKAYPNAKIDHKIKNRGVFKDLHNFEKKLYLSSLIILLVSLIIAVLLLLAEFVSGLKNVFQGMVYKICNIVNLVFCGVFAIISFVLFVIFCCINDTDRVIRKYHNPLIPKNVKNRSISHIILNLILFIILAIAAVLSFMAMNNGTSSSGSSSSSGGKRDNSSKNNTTGNKDETNKQIKENEPIKTNDNAGASERPLNLLTKDPPK